MLSLPDLSCSWLFDARRCCSKAVSAISDILDADRARTEARRQNLAPLKGGGGLNSHLRTVSNIHGIG